MADPEYVRLHIAPFNSSLLTTILPPSILPNARNISYHSVQTYPDRAYGYVDLPTMDADKIKKKLNGSILKGTKVRIESARPEREHIIEAPREEKPKVKKEKRTKRKRDEIPGVDIGERQVKRGWTVPATLVGKEKEKKKGGLINKSKYTTEPECLFKTILPQNVASQGNVKDTKLTRGTKGKEAVVHEFAKATKYATFLRSSSSGTKKKAVSEYVKGKGWVDEDGNVVEAVKGKTLLASKKPGLDATDVDSENTSDEEPPTAEKATEVEKRQTPEKEVVKPTEDSSSDDSSDDSSEDDATPKLTAKVKTDVEASSNDSSSDFSSEDEADEVEQKPVPSIKKTTPLPHVDLPTFQEEIATESLPNQSTPTTPTSKNAKSPTPLQSDSGSASESESDSDSSSEDEASSTPAKPTSRPTTSSGPINLSITIPPPPPTTSISTSTTLPAVHPLEALYKRPLPTTTLTTPSTKPSAPLFSFFNPDENDVDEEMEYSQPQVPLTPFTQRDFEWRGQRSAAPTPDTAHANKRFIWPSEQEEEDDQDGEDGPDAASKPRGKGNGVEKSGDGNEEGGVSAEADFQKWFYEHRGDANRAWKKRRKAVGKEKRQRENRKREERV